MNRLPALAEQLGDILDDIEMDLLETDPPPELRDRIGLALDHAIKALEPLGQELACLDRAQAKKRHADAVVKAVGTAKPYQKGKAAKRPPRPVDEDFADAE